MQPFSHSGLANHGFKRGSLSLTAFYSSYAWALVPHHHLPLILKQQYRPLPIHQPSRIIGACGIISLPVLWLTHISCHYVVPT
jgi:hypothetical protein